VITSMICMLRLVCNNNTTAQLTNKPMSTNK
jgi:hypothetical protein